MADTLILVLGALGAIGGLVLARFWGRAVGKREGKQKAEHDARQDEKTRTDQGRKSLREGRAAGTPAQRLQRNDDRW